MTRIAFPLRFGPGGALLAEPLAPTGHETYYHRRREWFTTCRDCHAVTPHPTKADATRAATTPCTCTTQPRKAAA